MPTRALAKTDPTAGRPGSPQESERRRDRWIAIAAVFGMAALMLPAACGRSLATGDAGGLEVDAAGDGAVVLGVDGAAADVGHDAPVDVVSTDASSDGDGGAGIACGSSLTCTGTDLCVARNTCSPVMRCDDVPDGGQCPPGSALHPNCQSTGRLGCVPTCPPTSYACVPKPSTCSGGISCGCLGFTFCSGASCAYAQGRAVMCAYQ